MFMLATNPYPCADGARLGGVEVIHVFDGAALSARAETALRNLESVIR